MWERRSEFLWLQQPSVAFQLLIWDKLIDYHDDCCSIVPLWWMDLILISTQTLSLFLTHTHGHSHIPIFSFAIFKPMGRKKMTYPEKQTTNHIFLCSVYVMHFQGSLSPVGLFSCCWNCLVFRMTAQHDNTEWKRFGLYARADWQYLVNELIHLHIHVKN